MTSTTGATTRAEALSAARTAGVTVCTVDDAADVQDAADFLADLWRAPRSAPPYPAEVLISLVHAGGAVHAAFDGQRLVGASVAVPGPPATESVYSLVAGAVASDRGIGYALKQAQRLWALKHDRATMRWTFDPLVGRNARFNLVKLGAVGTEYLVDFYGPMHDGVNQGDESDRITATWDLLAPSQPDGAQNQPDRATTAMVCQAPDGGPLAVRTDQRLWCRVPKDIVALRATAPLAALRWRHAVREVFTGAFADGFAATAMSRDGWYLLTLTDAYHTHHQKGMTL